MAYTAQLHETEQARQAREQHLQAITVTGPAVVAVVAVALWAWERFTPPVLQGVLRTVLRGIVGATLGGTILGGIGLWLQVPEFVAGRVSILGAVSSSSWLLASSLMCGGAAVVFGRRERD